MKVSFKAEVYHHRRRKDNNYSVIIRIGYKSKYAFIETDYSVPNSQLSKKGEIKNLAIRDKCNELISDYRKITSTLDPNKHLDVKDIKNAILSGSSVEQPLNFSSLFVQFLSENENSPSSRIYAATYNHLCRFAGSNVLVNDITPNFLDKFEGFLSPNMGSRGVNLYLSTLRTVYNWIIDEYEYKGHLFLYPFRKYKIPQAIPPKTVSLTKEQLITIRDFPATGLRAERARDLFMISLLSLGTNAKDLYLIESITDRMTYNRSKTKGRRPDRAEISIKVEPELRVYIDAYLKPSGGLLFSEWYSSPEQLNRMLVEGLKQLMCQIKASNESLFQKNPVYYDARRTVASVMRNKLGISKDDVAMCLNHSDRDTRITDRYIERDWSVIDRANRKFIDWLYS